ncbi:MAG: shikimate kinase [Bacteroidales bacterium]|nr:shikimate kinase [Lachnoclostridium sp.]MCM1383688.1 shikimate kinase [Lachnoclostridium sp.]MCM1466363.1 shikimate kinase [Bacteroidales bacterium]
MERKDNIILTGFMGSGKTSVGLKLSYRLKIPVEDTDKLIEQNEKRSISSIFGEEGEAYFRDRETELLQEIGKRNYRRILSVGGGTPVREENRRLLRQCGTVIYLRIQPETVYERLKDDTTRPLLAGENPLERIRELMEARKDAYEECADIIIDVDEISMEEILDRLEKELSRKRKSGGSKVENIGD